MNTNEILVVWPGTILEKEQHEDFKAFVKNELQGEVGEVLESVTTNPDLDSSGNPIPETGGRIDVFFTVTENTNMGVFAIRRLRAGMRWYSDVVGNNNHTIYPLEVQEKFAPFA